MNWLKHATVFVFEVKPPNEQRTIEDMPIRIEAREQRDGTRKWAVCQGGNCLRKDGFWEIERQPSSRSDEFLALTRYETKEQAYREMRARLAMVEER